MVLLTWGEDLESEIMASLTTASKVPGQPDLRETPSQNEDKPRSPVCVCGGGCGGSHSRVRKNRENLTYNLRVEQEVKGGDLSYSQGLTQ